MRVQLIIDGRIEIDEEVPVTSVDLRLTQLRKYAQGLNHKPEWELFKYRPSRMNCYAGRKRALGELEIAEMKELRNDGLSYREIGDRLGVSDCTIKNYLKLAS